MGAAHLCSVAAGEAAVGGLVLVVLSRGGFLPRVARASSYPGSSVLKQASPQADSRSSQSPKAGPGK